MTLLKYGMKGEAVAELQRALTAYGHPVADDGDFGEKTEAAVTAFQTACGLMADGKAGRDTLAALAGEDTSRVLKEADIRAAAEILAVEPAVSKPSSTSKARAAATCRTAASKSSSSATSSTANSKKRAAKPPPPKPNAKPRTSAPKPPAAIAAAQPNIPASPAP